jgi:hypothetical protein
MSLNNLPSEILEKIILYTDLPTAIIIGNKYCINKLYNDQSWISAVENNQLEVIKWLHCNKKNGYKTKVLVIAKDKNYKEIEKFLKTHEYDLINLREICEYVTALNMLSGRANLTYGRYR